MLGRIRELFSRLRRDLVRPGEGSRRERTTKRILGLAVTRLASGFCFAGLDLETGRWIRPVRPKVQSEYDRALLPCDFGCLAPHRFALAVSEWEDLCPAPTPPHVEDWLLAAPAPARVIQTPSAGDLARLLAPMVEESLAPVHPGR